MGQSAPEMPGEKEDCYHLKPKLWTSLVVICCDVDAFIDLIKGIIRDSLFYQPASKLSLHAFVAQVQLKLGEL